MIALRFIGLCLLFIIGAQHQALSQVHPDSTKKGKKGIRRDSTDIRIFSSDPDTSTIGGKKGIKSDSSTARVSVPPDTSYPGVDTLDPLISKRGERKLARLKKRKETMLSHNPNGALWRAFVLPGWGQIYNRKYWKLPLVYGALGGVGYGIGFYHQEYTLQRKAYICRNDTTCTDEDAFPQFTDGNLKDARDFSRRNRDLLIIVGVLVYSLQALDAYIDAHLMQFDISDNLSMAWRPNVILAPRKQDMYLGFTMNFILK